MFTKPNTILYVRRNNLFITGKHVPPANLSISNDLLTNMEFIDRENFIATCANFFSSHGMEGKKVLVVLDQGIIFKKTISLDNSDKDIIQTAVDKFVESIPFESGQRAFEQLETNNQLELYATNSDLFQAVAEALEQSKVRKIIAVTPSYAYKLSKDTKPTESIAQFLNNREVRKVADFLTSAPL